MAYKKIPDYEDIINIDNIEKFKRGELYDSYDFLGSHKSRCNGKIGICFNVWAPNAKNVEHLAKICGHSLSHFKLLFSQYFDTTPYVWMQRNRALEISELLRDPSIPLKSIIKKYGFTSHGHFSLFCRKFLGDTPRTLRRRSHLAATPVTIDEVKKHMERNRRQTAAVKKSAAPGDAPRRRGRPRKNEVK